MALPPRSVAVYAAGAQNWTHFDRGIPRYIVEHLRAMYALAPEAFESVRLNPSLPLTGNLNWLLGSGLLGWNTDQATEPARLARDAPSIYHVMSPFEPETGVETMWPAWARNSGAALVVTVYDLIPFIFADHYLSNPRARVQYDARADLIRHADGVLAISQSTGDDLVEHLGVAPGRIHVIHAGATDVFGPMYASRDMASDHLRRQLPSVRRGFLLYVGGVEFRKNLETLILGYARLPATLRAAHQLVIACRMTGDQMALLNRLGAESGLRPGELLLTGYVSDADLGALYHACTLFVFPSLYEGSGLPMLEAMACGAPVAASATSTGPEVLGDDEGTFDPRHPDAIAGCVAKILGSPELSNRLSERSIRRSRDYTWRRVAQESLQAYENVAAHRPRRRASRPRIALVTPWRPESSGIAQYNLCLASELGQLIDVDVVVANDLTAYAVPQEEGVRLIRARDFGWQQRLRQPDRILYCMGNSRFHGHVYEMLRRYPGAALFHDVRLTGFFGWYAGVEHPEDPAGRLAERLSLQYGSRLPAGAVRSGPPSWQQQLSLGMYMTREVQTLASECFVHSEFARDILELEQVGSGCRRPVSLLPFGMPTAAVAPRQARDPDRPLIISLGYVSEVKGISTLIAAFAAMSAQVPDARLVIAGPLEANEMRRWRRQAEDHGGGADIELLGEVSAECYAALLRNADLAVQLRLISNGEASAAIADCLAAGLPTIVTDLGWASELPDGTVSKLPLGVTADELASHILAMVGDGRGRVEMSQAALNHARACDFSEVAQAYLSALELV